MQISSTAMKTKIADLQAQLVRQLAKSNAKKSGIAMIFWDRLQFLVAVMKVGKSKDKRQNVEIKLYCSQKKCLVTLNKYWGVSIDDTHRLPNHPDFVGIIPILLENPESRPISDQDRKNPDFDSCCDIFVKFS